MWKIRSSVLETKRKTIFFYILLLALSINRQKLTFLCSVSKHDDGKETSWLNSFNYAYFFLNSSLIFASLLLVLPNVASITAIQLRTNLRINTWCLIYNPSFSSNAVSCIVMCVSFFAEILPFRRSSYKEQWLGDNTSEVLSSWPTIISLIVSTEP